ncbi:MAG: restriction endonuclease subunit S [Prevotella sp.]|nr:restriction endonuclease subunit S [Prevotella sp.]
MNAQQLRNSILQEAIEGRLVPQDPNDEPASILLDRIRKEKEILVKEGKLKKKDLIETPITEEEIPFEIPESWEWCRVNDLIYPPKYGTSNKSLENGVVPVLRMGNIKDGEIVFDKLVYSNDKVDNEKYNLISGDLLFNRTNSAELVGKTAIYRGQRPAIYAGYLILLRPIEINSDYLNFVLSSSYARSYCQEVKTIGVQQCNINAEKISSFILPLPPLAEQHRIVAKIEELLPKVEEYGKAQDELNKLNEELPERLKKSILQEAIEGRLVPQDPNDEPASVLLDKIRKEKEQLVKEGKLKKKDLIETPITEEEIPFEVPESWEWVKLGTLISYQNGYAYNSLEMNRIGKGVPVIKSGNLMTLEVVLKPNNDFIEYPTEKMLASKIVKGDMLMCLSSQSDNPEPLGKTAIYKFDTYALLNQRVLKIRPYKDELTLYLYYTINSFYFWYNVSHQGGGSAQANLKLNHVLDMQIPLPPLAEQHRIVAKIEELFAEIDKLKM